jgi:hypothetical protein
MKQLSKTVIGVVVALVLAIMAPMSASAVPSSASDTAGAAALPLTVISSGSDYVVVATSTGSFQMNDDGSVSVVSDTGKELFPLEASGISETGAAASVTYEPIGDNLRISSHGLGAESANVAAKGLTWGCVLSYLGLGLGTAGFIIATGGTATIFILGGASYVVSVASFLESCY